MDSALALLNNLIEADGTVVKVGPLPSYISCFFANDHNEDAILIYKTGSEAIRTIPNRNVGSDDEVDVTGQPLELPAEETLNMTASFLEFSDPYWKEEDSHFPLTLVNARTLISECNINSKILPPIWVLTGGNSSKMVLIGTQKTPEMSKRFWALSHGVVTANEFTEDNILLRHKNVLEFPQDAKTRCEVQCKYILVNRKCDDDLNLSYTKTSLRIFWNQLTLHPPLSKRSTRIELFTECRIGFHPGPLSFIWSQLVLIHKYIELAKEFNTDDRLNLALPDVSHILTNQMDKPPSSLISKIQSVFKEETLPFVDGLDLKSSFTVSEVVDMVGKYPNSNLDVTAKLWFLLIECTSYRELSTCLKRIFVELRDKKEMSMFNSISHLQLGDPSMDPVDPLNILIEIGLDKLKKDITSIFSKSRIISLFHLKMPKTSGLKDIKDANPAEWLASAESWLTWLGQIYTVIEFLLNTQSALGLREDALPSIVSSFISKLTSSSSPISSFGYLIAHPLQTIKTEVSYQLIENKIKMRDSEELLMTITTIFGKESLETAIFRRLGYTIFPNSAASNSVQIMRNDTTLSSLVVHSWAELNTHTFRR